MRKGRYEILLPLKHNDDRAVVAAAYETTQRERFEQIVRRKNARRGELPRGLLNGVAPG